MVGIRIFFYLFIYVITSFSLIIHIPTPPLVSALATSLLDSFSPPSGANQQPSHRRRTYIDPKKLLQSFLQWFSYFDNCQAQSIVRQRIGNRDVAVTDASRLNVEC